MKLTALVLSSVVVIILVGSVLAPLTSDQAQSGEDTLDVVVLAGQSNAAYNLLRVDPDVVNQEIPLPETNCYYFGTSAQGVQYAVTPIANCSMRSMVSNDSWIIGGEEPAIAQTIGKKTHDDVYVINVAIGGQPISNFIPGSTGGDWIDEVLTAALNQIPSHYTINYCGWVWIQGESDQTTAVEDYIADFDKIKSNFAEYGFNDCYLVKTRYIDSLNATQAHNAILTIYPDVVLGSDAPESFSVSNGLLRQGDTLHYSQAGRNVVGNDVGEIMASSLSTHIRENMGQGILKLLPAMIILACVAAGAVFLMRSKNGR